MACSRRQIGPSGFTSTNWVSRRNAGEGTVCQVDSERSVPTEKAWWGYDAIRIVDPDGNELLFPLDETNDRERQT